VSDDKKDPGIPGVTGSDKPAGATGGDGGAPKPDLDALRAKLGFKPSAPASPTAARPGVAGIPGLGGTKPAAGPAGTSKGSAAADSELTGEFHLAGSDAGGGSRELSAKELAELDASLSRGSRSVTAYVIIGVFAVAFLAGAVLVGMQVGKGMGQRSIYNESIVQANNVRSYFARGQTDPQGVEMAVRGEAATKLKAGLDAFMEENQELIIALSEIRDNKAFPDDFPWNDVKSKQLEALSALLVDYLDTAPEYKATDILGGQAFSPELAGEVANFVGRSNSLRGSVEQALTAIDIIRTDIVMPEAPLGEMQDPDATAFVFAPNVERKDTKVLEAAIVQLKSQLSNGAIVTEKTKKEIKKVEKCIATKIDFEWGCTPCSAKAEPETGKQEIDVYDLQVTETVEEIPVADVVALADKKPREIEIQHLYAVDMLPYVKPLTARISQLEERHVRDRAAINAAAASALSIFFERMDDVQRKAQEVDLGRLMKLVNELAEQEAEFVL